MKNNTNHTQKKDFYNSIKVGDVIGFYKSGLFSALIDLFSEDKKRKICHVGVVYNLKRFGNYLTFELSEQTASHGGQLTKYKFVNNNDKITFSNPRKYKKFFLKSYDKSFNVLQKQNGYKDAKAQYKKFYGFWTLLFSAPTVSAFLAKIGLSSFFQNTARVCSKHVIINQLKAGRNGAKEFLDKNPNPTPEGVFNYNEFDFKGTIIEIDLSN